MMHPAKSLTLFELLAIAVPGFTTVIALAFAEPIGVVTGIIWTVAAVVIYPLALVPLLLVAGGFQQAVTLAGLQVGWWFVIGAAFGVGLKIFFDSGRFGYNRSLAIVVVAFALLAIIISLMDPDFRFDRFGTLIILLIMLSIFARILSPTHNKDLPLTGTTYAILISGLVVVLYLILLITSGKAYLARGTELGLSLGVNESSPSGISRMLAFTLVTAVMLAVVGQIKGLVQTLFLILVILLCCFGMMYTGSRMPMFAATIAISVGVVIQTAFAWHSYKFSSVFLIALFVIFAVYVASIIASGQSISVPFLGDREFALRLARAPSIDGNIRFRYWAEHFQKISDFQFIIGSGIGVLRNPHSVWVGSLSTFGLIGFAVVLHFYLSVARAAYINRSSLGFALLIYIGLSYSSSSDVDRPQFWILMTLVILLVGADAIKHGGKAHE